MIRLGVILPSINELSDFDFQQNIKFAEFSGVYIPDSEFNIAKGIRQFSKPNEIYQESDAIVFVGEHSNYHCLIVNALKNSKHIKILAPEKFSAAQLSNFLKLAYEANVSIEADSKWYEYSNISSGIHYISSPSLIEFKQSIGFNISSKPYEFFMKRIFNAIYFSLFTIRSNPKKIYALGISTFTKTIDFINASVEFDNGSIIRLQIGAIDTNEYIKCRIHQKNAIASFDLENMKSNIYFLNVFKDIDNQAFDAEKEANTKLYAKCCSEFIENIQINRFNHKSVEIAYESALLTEQILEKLKIRSEVKQLFAID